MCSSPMGPCQGMSDSVRAAEASMKENIFLAKDLKKNLRYVENMDVWDLTHLHW